MSRERREEYSTSNVVRVLHPTRPLSPHNNVIDFDNNLDYLLDDLQSSVRSKNDSNFLSLSSKSRDVQYLSPSNETTVIRERSISPGGENRKMYKTSHYEYSTSSGVPGQLDVQSNINSLDTLLDDLKHEREASLDRGDKNFSNVGIDSGLLEPSNTRVTTTKRTYTTNTSGSNKAVNRELQFETIPVVTTQTTTSRQSRSRQRSPTNYHVETKVSRDVSYDSDPTIDVVSTTNRSYNNYSSQGGGEPQQIVPYNQIVEVDSSTLPNEFNGVPLSGDLLPGPGTKVTTTIKTFTYEIPGGTAVPTNQTFTYKNENYNTTNVHHQPDVPQFQPNANTLPPGGNKTIVYKNETYNTINRVDGGYPGYPNEQRPRSPHPHPVEPQTTNVIYKRETRDTSNVYNSSPGYQNPPHATGLNSPPGQNYGQPGSPPNQTIIYKHDVTNTNTNIHHPPAGGIPVYPYNPNNNLPPQHQTGPDQPGFKQTYLYKTETTNTKNRVYGPPGSGGYPPNDNGYPSPNQNYTALPPAPHHQPRYPNESPNTTYKYITNTSTTTRNVHGHPDDRQPLLAPFPTDGVDHSHVDGNPPKRLDDLLATLGDQNGHGRPTTDEPYTPRKEVNTALTSNKSVAIVDPKVPTKNIAGPPVYYPPGHELFAKNEQSAAAWRAQGGWAKGSGRYEYESESKSKSSSKSGAAVVPVCLPLCCAMPCVIM